jgi:hypothetical protein
MTDPSRLSPHVRATRTVLPAPRLERVSAVALGVSAIWLVLVGAYAVGWFGARGADGADALTVLLFLLAAIGPVTLFAAAAALLRRAEAIRAEAASLRAALPSPGAAALPGFDAEALTRAAARAAREATAAETADLAARLERMEARLDAALLSTQPPAAAPKPPRPPQPRRRAEPRGQAALPFAEEAAPEPPRALTWDDLARALDFPRDEGDAEGFAALEAALTDPEFRDLLQAAEDVLALLAAMGLHMEDVTPETPSVEAWTAYAEGARGAKAGAVGGVRDPEALEAVKERARTDPVFRDAGLVFARRWNGLVARVLRDVGPDPLLQRLGDTRSGRAFMLVARALGAFD